MAGENTQCIISGEMRIPTVTVTLHCTIIASLSILPIKYVTGLIISLKQYLSINTYPSGLWAIALIQNYFFENNLSFKNNFLNKTETLIFYLPIMFLGHSFNTELFL